MRNLAFIIILMITAYGTVNAQNCNLQGIVRYKYNDQIGFKVDIGAEVRIIEVHEAKAVIRVLWQKYNKLAENMLLYLSVKKETDDEETIRRLTGFSKEKEAEMIELSEKCLMQYIENANITPYNGLIDSSGKYSFELPYGNYFVFVKSANRTRPTLLELSGRVILERITVDKPTQMLSFDIDY